MLTFDVNQPIDVAATLAQTVAEMFAGIKQDIADGWYPGAGDNYTQNKSNRTKGTSKTLVNVLAPKKVKRGPPSQSELDALQLLADNELELFPHNPEFTEEQIDRYIADLVGAPMGACHTKIDRVGATFAGGNVVQWD